MDHRKIPTLVIEHCLCDGCKNKFNTLKQKIPQVHSIKFYTEKRQATISGAVDAATVMKELAEEGIMPKILSEKSSPINNHHRQKQIALPEHSRRDQVHPSGSTVHRGEQVRQSRSRVSPSGSESRSTQRGSQSRSESRSIVSRSGSQSQSQIQSGSRSRTESRSRDSRSESQSQSQIQSGSRSRSQSQSGSTVSRNGSRSEISRSGSQSRSKEVPRESHKPAEFANCYLNHKHELVKVRGSNKRFSCNGCKEDGFKSRYRCERCDFDLHYECRFPKRTISPEINKELVFEFRPQKPPKERICDACGKCIHGCFYNCGRLDLHPRCARLKAQVRNRDMVLLLRQKVSSECLWCRKKKPPGTEAEIPGWCYVSECNQYKIHIHCITQMLHEAWQRGLMDGTGENSIRNINFQRVAVSDRNRGGRRGTEVALKIIGILRIVVGILLGDPSVLFGKLMFEFLEQLL